MFCRFCGKQVNDGSSFCRFCGKQFGEVQRQTVQQQPKQRAMPESETSKKQWMKNPKIISNTVCVAVICACIIGLVNFGGNDSSNDYYKPLTFPSDTYSYQDTTQNAETSNSSVLSTDTIITSTDASTPDSTSEQSLDGYISIPDFVEFCSDIGFSENYISDTNASYQKSAGDVAAVKSDMEVIEAYTELLESSYGFDVELTNLLEPDEIYGVFIYGWLCEHNGSDGVSSIFIEYEGTTLYHSYVTMTYSNNILIGDYKPEPSTNASVNYDSAGSSTINIPGVGTGMTCSSCKGTGSIECFYCDRGFKMCTLCHGTGTYRAYGQSGDCSCLNGQTSCNMCGGDGTTRCSACGGDGKL